MRGGLVILALVATPAIAMPQSLSDDLRLPSFEGGQAIVRIQVFQEAPYAGREITLYATPTHVPGADPVNGTLSAIRTRTDGPPQVARSADCPAIRAGLEAMRLIPPVRVVPSALAPRSDGPIPIPPTKKDGARYEIRVQVAAPNTATSLLTINDYSGDYARWADETVGGLERCWSPLF